MSEVKKFALCISSPDELTDLATKKVDTIEARLVDREICEETKHELHQLIPYVTFYAVHPDEGKVEILQYERPTETEEGENVSESRLAGMTSVGFGGHIDCEEDIVYSEKKTVTSEYKGEEEDETIQEEEVVYVMTMDQVMETTRRVLAREVKEELGKDYLEHFDITIQPNEMMIFKGKEANSVNRVHLALACLVPLTPDELKELKETAEINKDEIKEVAYLGIRFGDMLAEFDVSRSVEGLVNKLREDHSLEDWSRIVVETILYGLCRIVINTMDWKAIHYIHKARIQAYEQQQAEAEAQEQKKAEGVAEAPVSSSSDSSDSGSSSSSE